MKKNFFYLVASFGVALSASQNLAHATSTATTAVSTVPEGVMQFTMPAGKTTCLSMPLTASPVYNGVVSSVTSTTISVATSPAPFSTSLSATGSPYFVEFLSGNEAGRIMLITANTTSTLTLDISDNQASWMNVGLTCSNYSVKAGDSFMIFPGDTLASVFGTGTSGGPLLLTGGASASSADQVTLENATCLTNPTYFFNTAAGYWEETGSTANANSTVIYPYQAVSVARVSSGSAVSMLLVGQTAVVKTVAKTISGSWTFGGTHYAVGMKLSQLDYGSNWTKSNNAKTADLMCIWNPSEGAYDNYYEDTSSNWHLVSSPSANQNNFVIPAGDGLCIGKMGSVNGGKDFLVDAMPYTVTAE